MQQTPPTFARPGWWYGLGLVMLLVVMVLSLLPSPNLGGSDKTLHFLTYACLTAWFALLSQSRLSLLAVCVLIIAFGALLELLQGFTDYRVMDSRDLLANVIGTLLGAWVYFTPLWRIARQLENRLVR